MSRLWRQKGLGMSLGLSVTTGLGVLGVSGQGTDSSRPQLAYL